MLKALFSKRTSHAILSLVLALGLALPAPRAHALGLLGWGLVIGGSALAGGLIGGSIARNSAAKKYAQSRGTPMRGSSRSFQPNVSGSIDLSPLIRLAQRQNELLQQVNSNLLNLTTGQGLVPLIEPLSNHRTALPRSTIQQLFSIAYDINTSSEESLRELGDLTANDIVIILGSVDIPHFLRTLDLIPMSLTDAEDPFEIALQSYLKLLLRIENSNEESAPAPSNNAEILKQKITSAMLHFFEAALSALALRPSDSIVKELTVQISDYSRSLLGAHSVQITEGGQTYCVWSIKREQVNCPEQVQGLVQRLEWTRATIDNVIAAVISDPALVAKITPMVKSAVFDPIRTTLSKIVQNQNEVYSAIEAQRPTAILNQIEHNRISLRRRLQTLNSTLQDLGISALEMSEQTPVNENSSPTGENLRARAQILMRDLDRAQDAARARLDLLNRENEGFLSTIRTRAQSRGWIARRSMTDEEYFNRESNPPNHTQEGARIRKRATAISELSQFIEWISDFKPLTGLDLQLALFAWEMGIDGVPLISGGLPPEGVGRTSDQRPNFPWIELCDRLLGDSPTTRMSVRNPADLN